MLLTGDQALMTRMRSLLLHDRSVPRSASVESVVEWFGAMQAQEYSSILWSLGRRLPGSTVADVEAALQRREAVRTWPMRGTLHLVPAHDARWHVRLTAPRPLAAARTVRARLGLTDDVAARAVGALADALSGGRQLTRAQCGDVLAAAGVDVTGPRLYHLLAYSAEVAVTCLGPSEGTAQTFVLLDEWAPGQREPDRDEALAVLALRYFRSHGPATRHDFAGWSGLTMADARLAIAAAGEELTSATLGDREVHLAVGALDTAEPTGALDALSGFDEYLLGYKDRSLMVDPDQFAAVVPGRNGVFQWTVLREGRVVATWKRRTTVDGVSVVVTPLPGARPLGTRERGDIEQALQPYGRFVGRPLDITWQ